MRQCFSSLFTANITNLLHRAMPASSSDPMLMKTLHDAQSPGAPSYQRAGAAASPALATNLSLVAQARSLLRELSDEQFQTSFPPAEGAIGAHLRHVIEFYQAFLIQWHQGEVCYHQRARNRDIETRVEIADKALAEVEEQLSRVPAHRTLKIIHFDGDHSQSDTTRELSYLADHAVHHYALIQLVAKLGGLRLDKSFGYAQSTLASRR